MEQQSLSGPFKEIIEDFKSYVENMITYNKLVFVRGASELSSYLILLILLFGISGFVLLFFSFAFAGWFSHITGWGPGAGYLVVALFYLILAFVVYHYRRPLIFNPARKLFGEIFFGDFNNEEFEFKFDSQETHNENIKKVQEKLNKQKESLNEKVKTFEENFTIANLVQEILGRAYTTIVTTSNVARFAYSIVKKLKGFSRKKKHKTSKTKQVKE